jgi:DNA-binding beta-propeller fold protein YncE
MSDRSNSTPRNLRWQKALGGCGKTHKCVQCRGRAALQRRVKHPKSARASAPVVAFCVYSEFFRTLLVIVAVILCLGLPAAAAKPAKTTTQPAPPDLLLDGGRKLTFERTFSVEREVKPKRGFWTRVVDVIAGEPEFHFLVTPYSIATDSHGRVIVTDPGADGIHIFDFTEKKYKFLSRKDSGKDPMLAPQCVAVDAQDNIYVTDSQAGKIFVFDPSGKFRRMIGRLKGGEGFFKRPTGIAVDSAAQRIYITDTLRNKIYVMDMQGSVLSTIGKAGTGDAEFNYPTELRLNGAELFVVDAMNFRVQVLDRSGTFHYAIGKLADGAGGMFRPKGISFDSEGHLYVVDGLWGMVQAFDRQGRLLYYFGQHGTGLGQFQLPTGLEIDNHDRIYVVDSFNRRIEVFHYYASAAAKADGGAKPESAKP